MSLTLGRSNTSISEPICTRNLPSRFSSIEPTAATSDSTSTHLTLWLIGCAKIALRVSRWWLFNRVGSGSVASWLMGVTVVPATG